ncbi:hypothetical protein BYT27DRAFT_7185885 [Phlegmacium glaucopus]|nr:hypothetical protein BYT27DRAFT_7185885 [Phlegmacium glaucopus]
MYELKNGPSVLSTFGPASLASYNLILRSPHPTFLFDLFRKSSKVTPATPGPEYTYD